MESRSVWRVGIVQKVFPCHDGKFCDHTNSRLSSTIRQNEKKMALVIESYEQTATSSLKELNDVIVTKLRFNSFDLSNPIRATHFFPTYNNNFMY